MLHKNFGYERSQIINAKKMQINRNSTSKYSDNNYLIQKKNLNYIESNKNIIEDLSDIDKLASNIATQINQIKINTLAINEKKINNYFNNSTYSIDAKSKEPKAKKIPKQYINLPGTRENQNLLNRQLIEYIATDNPITSNNNFFNNNFNKIKIPSKKNSKNNISVNSFNLSNNIININNNKKILNFPNKNQKLNCITHRRIFSTGVDNEIKNTLDNFKYNTSKKFFIPNFHSGIFDSYFIKSNNNNKNEIDNNDSNSVIKGNNSSYANDNKSTKSKTQNNADKNSTFTITSNNNINKNNSKNNDINISPFLTLDYTQETQKENKNNSNEILTLNLIANNMNNMQDKNVSDEKNKENKFEVFEPSIEQKVKTGCLLDSIRQNRKIRSFNNSLKNIHINHNNNSHSKIKKSNRKKVQFCNENIIIRFEPKQCVQNLIVYNSHGKKQIKKFFKTETYLNSIKFKNNKKSILKNCDNNYKIIPEIDKNINRIQKTYSFNRNRNKIKIKNSFYIKKNLELKKKKYDKILSNEFINQIFDYSNLVNEEKAKNMKNYNGIKRKNSVFLNDVNNLNKTDNKNQLIIALKTIENYIEETI